MNTVAPVTVIECETVLVFGAGTDTGSADTLPGRADVRSCTEHPVIADRAVLCIDDAAGAGCRVTSLLAAIVFLGFHAGHNR